MARVEIAEKLKVEIFRKFRGNSVKVFKKMKILEKFPKKGKFLGQVGNVAIKELKWRSFRFYFVSDAFGIRFLGIEELEDLLIKFVRMSDKKKQGKVIGEIRDFLRGVERGKF